MFDGVFVMLLWFLMLRYLLNMMVCMCFMGFFSEEILPRITRRTLAQHRQINHPSSNQIYTKSTPKHIHHHYAPYVILTHTTQDTHHLFNCTHIRTTLSPLDLWTSPAGVTALLADHKREDRTPPTSKGHGSG